MARRWIRLDVGWEDSSWLDALSGAAAGCWPRLLCTVKRDGINGRCKRIAPGVAARRWRVEEKHIAELEQAAIADGALRINGSDWVIVNWAEYQDVDPTAAERKRRQREKQATDVTDVTRDKRSGRRDLSCATETVTETETEITEEQHLPPPAASPTRTREDEAADDGGQAAAVAEMTTDLSVEITNLNDSLRPRLRAAAKPVIEGADRTAWLDPRTKGAAPIPWADRPALFRLALSDCLSEGACTQRALSGKVRYHALRQLDPHEMREHAGRNGNNGQGAHSGRVAAPGRAAAPGPGFNPNRRRQHGDPDPDELDNAG